MERRLTAGGGLLTRIMLGPGELLAQGLNVLLTAASGGFLFLLGRRWGAARRDLRLSAVDCLPLPDHL